LRGNLHGCADRTSTGEKGKRKKREKAKPWNFIFQRTFIGTATKKRERRGGWEKLGVQFNTVPFPRAKGGKKEKRERKRIFEGCADPRSS